jgi:hypothetical protein
MRTGSLLACPVIRACLRERDTLERVIGKRVIGERDIRERAIGEPVATCRFDE